MWNTPWRRIRGTIYDDVDEDEADVEGDEDDGEEAEEQLLDHEAEGQPAEVGNVQAWK